MTVQDRAERSGRTRAFRDYVEAHRRRFVSELVEYCRTPAIASLNVGCDESAQTLARRLERLGAAVRLISIEDAPPVVLGSIGAGERSLLLYNHYDVQPAGPIEQWSNEPFAPAIREGLLYGRGVADNRGNIFARLQAVEAYQESVGPLPLRAIFLVEGEEEIGSPHLARFVTEHARALQADGCLWEGGWKDLEGHPVIYAGVKGVLRLTLTAKGPNRDLHAMWSAAVPNPAWRLAHVLAHIADPDGRVSIPEIQKQVPHPTLADRWLLDEIPFDAERLKAEFGVARFVSDRTGSDVLEDVLFEPGFNINTLMAGHLEAGMRSVLPSAAVAKLNIYLVPGLEAAEVVDAIRAHLHRAGLTDVDLETEELYRASRSDPNSEIARSAMLAATRVYSQRPLLYPLIAGGGPMHLIADGLGIPVVSFGVENALSNVHAPDENIAVGDYVEGIHFIGELFSCFGVSVEPKEVH